MPPADHPWRQAALQGSKRKRIEKESVQQGQGRDAAVVGLALRFALNARPAGSQGDAPGQANGKTDTKNQRKSKKPEPPKGDTSNEVSKGTFLKSFDTLLGSGAV